jgi:very-short-patch-repair endonuclease
VNLELKSILDSGGGLLTRQGAEEVVPGWVIDHARRRGDLWRVLPGIYLAAGSPVTAAVRRRAALAWLDGRGALSHATALGVWGVHEAAPHDEVHVTVPRTVRLRSQPGVAVHRRASFTPEPPHALVRQDQLVTPLERSLVDAWPELPRAHRRAPVVRAVNDRMTTPGRIRSVLDGAPRLAGRADLVRLLDLLADGCLSPLEIWGHQHVFTAPGMPPFRRQVRVRVGTRSVYMDVYAEQEMVNFELDGASVHGDRRQREVDLRRDALLATLGILVVRFTHRRLVYETGAVRDEVLAILASRRAVVHRPRFSSHPLYAARRVVQNSGT